MSTLKIDPTTGDLQITNNSLVLETDISAETKQRLTAKFKTFLGEWFLNADVGLPYYQDILVKNPDTRQIQNIFREVILRDEQVAELESPLVMDYTSSTRELSIRFEALLNDGTYLSFAELVLGENR